ncbi:hypothetical protein Tco_0842007 [Tanacetum coccineum]|uniref:Uncharacterized protein n=1 Tax=Tanacetum coccineum TaxID=301880 RepID=A0ABQ5AY28_9ASTR
MFHGKLYDKCPTKFKAVGKLISVSYKSKKCKKIEEVQAATNVRVKTLYVQQRSEQKNWTTKRYLEEANPATKEEAKLAKEETEPAAKEEGKDDKKELVDIVKKTLEFDARGVEYGEEVLRYRTTIDPCVVV